MGEFAPQSLQIVWEYSPANGDRLPYSFRLGSAQRLPNGNTLITDSKNSRIIEVTGAGEIVWSYRVDYFSKFYSAQKLDDGNVLISDQQGHLQWDLRLPPFGTETVKLRYVVKKRGEVSGV